MNQFHTNSWSGGRAGDFYYFGFEGSPGLCSIESFIHTVVPEETCHVLSEYIKNSESKRTYRGSEFQEEVAKYILSLAKAADVYILDTPSVLYVFCKSKELRDIINGKIRSL